MGTNNKIRAALEQVKEIARTIYSTSEKGSSHEDLAEKIVELARAALAEPVRNCDRYSHDEALQVWAAENENERNGCFDEWLYHAVTEKEGDKDENE